MRLRAPPSDDAMEWDTFGCTQSFTDWIAECRARCGLIVERLCSMSVFALPSPSQPTESAAKTQPAQQKQEEASLSSVCIVYFTATGTDLFNGLEDFILGGRITGRTTEEIKVIRVNGGDALHFQ